MLNHQNKLPPYRPHKSPLIKSSADLFKKLIQKNNNHPTLKG